MIKKLDQRGFTIVELLIATAVFASVLFIVTYGIIQISKMFTNGFIQTETQNVAVSLSDQLTRDIEFSSAITSDQGPITSGGITYYYFCTSQYEYFYTPGANLYKIPISIIAKCQSPQSSWITTYSQTQTLLSSSMEILNNLSAYNDSSQQSIISSGSVSGLYSVNLDILYGNTSNLEQNASKSQWVCKPTVIVGPFCATYTLETGAYAQ